MATGAGLDYALTSAQLRCIEGGDPVQFGGGTTPNTDLVCPGGQIMVGLRGTLAYPYGAVPVVGAIGPRCQPPAGGLIVDGPAPLPAGGTPFLPIDCPPGQAVTGVVGGQGAVVDSIALVCATVPVVPPTPTITSVSPAAQADGSQMLTINGINLPALSESDVLFNQGGSDVPANYVWSASPTRVIARLPGLAIGAPTTVRLKNPLSTVTTNTVPLAITATPGTPVLTGVLASCAGGPIANLTPGAWFAITGEGIDTTGTTIVWTPVTAAGPVLTQNFLSTTAGPTGELCSYPSTPLAPGSNIGAPTLTPGTWNVTIRRQGAFGTSADSNAVLITVR